jgi:hypothetical protein
VRFWAVWPGWLQINHGDKKNVARKNPSLPWKNDESSLAAAHFPIARHFSSDVLSLSALEKEGGGRELNLIT